MSYADVTWKFCASCSPDSKEDCRKCWSEWTRANNCPLTLEELLQMDGEPVWVCFSGSIIYEDGWFIITETEKCEALLKGKASVYKDFECYGKTWMAYRQKQEKLM